MKFRRFVNAGIGACLAFSLGSIHAQELTNGRLRAYFGVAPWDEGTREGALAQAAAGATIPLVSYNVTATKDGGSYSGTIVGTSPFAATLSGVTTNAVVVPLIVTIDSVTFDPTAANACDSGATTVSRFNSSPIVAASSLTFDGVNVGNVQFTDGFRRAEFWNQIGGSAAYTNPISFTTAAPVSIATKLRGTIYGSGCAQLGILSYAWLDSQLRKTVMPALTSSGVISPSSLVIFLMNNVVQSTSFIPNVNTCCILGYHGATGNPVQTYSPMDWETTGLFGTAIADGSIASHEVAEWMDDPLGTNPTPAWGGIGQVSGCQGNLEVGDPLTGNMMPVINLGGYNYHMQEMAYFSWFFNAQATPSLGTAGKFSGNNTFAGPAKICPPGGTF